jgi:AraC-like DNA-binding protein
MKAEFEDIPSKQGLSSFHLTRINVNSFEFKWHYHPEYELTYIVRGSGYRVVGNSQEHFSSGDLVLLGSNIPHTWWGETEDGRDSEAIVIQFSKAFIEPILELNESQSIRELLERSSKGVRWNDTDHLFQRIENLCTQKDFDRILALLSVLHALSNKAYTQLASNSYQNIHSKKFESRINKVCSYLQNHYSESITLKQMAELVHMSESNFCKFFKKATSSTFSNYMNDLRINAACHLLLSSENNIHTIAEDSGFKSLSYFNRVFLRKMNCSPAVYRQGIK